MLWVSRSRTIQLTTLSRFRCKKLEFANRCKIFLHHLHWYFVAFLEESSESYPEVSCRMRPFWRFPPRVRPTQGFTLVYSNESSLQRYLIELNNHIRRYKEITCHTWEYDNIRCESAHTIFQTRNYHKNVCSSAVYWTAHTRSMRLSLCCLFGYLFG